MTQMEYKQLQTLDIPQAAATTTTLWEKRQGQENEDVGDTRSTKKTRTRARQRKNNNENEGKTETVKKGVLVDAHGENES